MFTIEILFHSSSDHGGYYLVWISQKEKRKKKEA